MAANGAMRVRSGIHCDSQRTQSEGLTKVCFVINEKISCAKRSPAIPLAWVACWELLEITSRSFLVPAASRRQADFSDCFLFKEE